MQVSGLLVLRTGHRQLRKEKPFRIAISTQLRLGWELSDVLPLSGAVLLHIRMRVSHTFSVVGPVLRDSTILVVLTISYSQIPVLTQFIPL